MARTRWLGAAGLAMVLTVAACGEADPSPPTPADLRDIDLSVDHTVAVSDEGFDPATLELTAGEVVRLVNEGDSEHSFTAEDRSFDTGRMQPGEDVTLVLTEPGKTTFFDLADRDHEGTFDVQPAG